MKVRVKFRKNGVMKFIGHLDIMRYFQKAIRRAELPAAFSGGYSPHMIMSFANPLGVGLTSDGEYFDMELTERVYTAEAVRRLNAVMVEGVEVINVVEIPDSKKETGMAIVAAADYLISCDVPEEIFAEESLAAFFSQEEILIEKETKKSKKLLNIRTMIYRIERRGKELYLLLSAGSKENLKPSLVMEAYLNWLHREKESVRFTYHRLETYALVAGEKEGEEQLAPLDALGTRIE